MTDLEIEQGVTKAGGGWDGDHWKFEDADLHPFVRGLLVAERERLAQKFMAQAKDAHDAGHYSKRDELSACAGLVLRA